MLGKVLVHDTAMPGTGTAIADTEPAGQESDPQGPAADAGASSGVAAAPCPGTLFRHYAPRAEALVVTGDSREQQAKVRDYLAAHPDRRVALLATAENAPVYQQMQRGAGAVHVEALGSRNCPGGDRQPYLQRPTEVRSGRGASDPDGGDPVVRHRPGGDEPPLPGGSKPQHIERMIGGASDIVCLHRQHLPQPHGGGAVPQLSWPPPAAAGGRGGLSRVERCGRRAGQPGGGCHHGREGDRPGRPQTASLTAEKVRWADLILTMEEHQRQRLLERFPEAAGKAFVLKEYVAVPGAAPAARIGINRPGSYDILDPFGQSTEAYRRCATELASAVADVCIDVHRRMKQGESRG